MNDCGKLRQALADLIEACGQIECDSQEAMKMGQACLDAKRVLDDPEEPRRLCISGDWEVRYSKVRHHEGELTLAVYDAAGNTVARVLPNGDREKAESDVRLMAAAPRLLDSLRGACKFMRNAGMCIHPDCSRCKIGACLQTFCKDDSEESSVSWKDDPEITELRDRCERFQGVIRILEGDVKMYRERCKVLENYVKSFCKNKNIKDRCGVIECESCDIRKTLKMYQEIKGRSE